MSSSSGGVATALSEEVIRCGGVVYGAAFDPHFVVRHVRIENVQELPQLRGSKYIQSDMDSTIRNILEDLSPNRIVLFIGTPCQVDGVRRYVNAGIKKHKRGQKKIQRGSILLRR